MRTAVGSVACMVCVCSILCGMPVLVSLAGAASAPGGSTPPESPGPAPPVFAFAQGLWDEGEYYRAIGEFQRFLFVYPDHPLVSEAQLRIAMAFFCGERWVQAFELFRRIARSVPETAIGQIAALGMGETRARGGDHREATRLYQEIIDRSPGTPGAERASYLLGWSLLGQRQWHEARAAFAAVPTYSRYHASAGRLAAALDPPPALPHRSPAVARALAMALPGAGQLYTGNAVDGIIGLGVHGALIGGTTAAALAGLEGAAGIGAFFAWGFYRTQVSNAAVSARDFNAQAEERFLRQLGVQEQSFLTQQPLAIACPR